MPVFAGVLLEVDNPPAGVPQIPALAFSFAILARLGPLFCVGVVVLIPAFALAEDHRLPNTSPDAFLPDGAVGLLVVRGVPDGDLIPGWDGCCGCAKGTEVK